MNYDERRKALLAALMEQQYEIEELSTIVDGANSDADIEQRLQGLADKAHSIGLTSSHSSRLALSETEAAESLGIELSVFEQLVKPQLRVKYCGPLCLIPVSELQDWLERS